MGTIETTHRGAKRKAQTREKILAGAKRLLKHDLSEVTVKHITEEADVGLGTFYNHFDTKMDVLKAIGENYFIKYNEQLLVLTSGIDDPAEIIAVSYRYTLIQAMDKDTNSIFQQLPHPYLLDLIVQRAVSDTQRGIESGRFNVENPKAMLCLLAGGLIAVMDYLSRGILSKKDAERTAVSHLYLHGISQKEAEEIVAREMPK